MKTIKVNVIKKFMKDNNLSKTKFCKICGIGLATFDKILLDKTNFRIVALFKVARVMKINVCDFIYWFWY